MKSSLKASLGAMLAAGLLSTAAHAAGAGVSVALDNARPVTLPAEATSVIVGNPAIADLYVQDGRHIFVLGRSFGTTNLVALDKEGKQIVNMPVTVTSGQSMAVTLHRGTAGQLSYACNGRCERAVVPGDSSAEYKELIEAVNGKTAQGDSVADAAAAAGK